MISKREVVMYLKPAQYVIHIFKGVRATARAIGRSPGAVSRWNRPRSLDGCYGNIPGSAQRIILRIAKKKKLDITACDLLCGRDVPKKKVHVS